MNIWLDRSNCKSVGLGLVTVTLVSCANKIVLDLLL